MNSRSARGVPYWPFAASSAKACTKSERIEWKVWDIEATDMTQRSVHMR
jgi:hypothetical protein